MKKNVFLNFWGFFFEKICNRLHQGSNQGPSGSYNEATGMILNFVKLDKIILVILIINLFYEYLSYISIGTIVLFLPFKYPSASCPTYEPDSPCDLLQGFFPPTIQKQRGSNRPKLDTAGCAAQYFNNYLYGVSWFIVFFIVHISKNVPYRL